MWGPQHTTWLPIREHESWQPAIYGFRAMDIINESPFHLSCEPCRLRIRDFNPHIAWSYDTEDTAGQRGRADDDDLSPSREPLGSALPYREIISEELFDVTETLMDESRILLLKVSRKLSWVPLLTTNYGRVLVGVQKSMFWNSDYSIVLTPRLATSYSSVVVRVCKVFLRRFIK